MTAVHKYEVYSGRGKDSLSTGGTFPPGVVAGDLPSGVSDWIFMIRKVFPSPRSFRSNDHTSFWRKREGDGRKRDRSIIDRIGKLLLSICHASHRTSRARRDGAAMC